jgi:filamentous hemagglutinin family protein
VARGSATISQTATAQAAAMTVNQSSQRAIINWDSFNLGSAASINFVQPNAQAVTLNRANDHNPSQIFGRITSNGQVFLSNPSGVYFSPTASVDVGALVATSHSISDANFMAGNYQFERNGATGKVVNEGRISAGLGGYVALLAPEVQNAGVVLARAGTVALAAGEVISLQVQGGGLAGITTTPSAIQTLIENKLAVQAPDGQIILSAVALNKLQASVIKNSGSLEANSLVAKGGKIYLEADDITLAATSKIEAKGPTGGGTVLVGGDWQGTGDMRQATKVTMEAGASINASATDQGDGGKVVLWSDVRQTDGITRVAGTVLAEGKGEQTKGGQIETSGASLHIAESANVQMGGQGSSGGLWLLDPTDFSIAPTGGDIRGANLSASISAGNTVEVFSNGATGTVGAIKIKDAISWNNTGVLKLSPTTAVQGDITGNIAMLGGGELIVNQPNAGYLYGKISGTGKVSTIGLGSLTLGGTNTYSGGTTVGANASLILSKAPVMSGTTITSSAVGTGSLTLNSGSMLTLGTTSTVHLPNYIFINGATTIKNVAATAPNISGVIADGSTPGQSLTLIATNISMELSGNNTYTGITTMGSGNYFISHSNALGASNSGTVLALGATLNLKGGITIDDALEGQGIYIKNVSGANTIRSALTITNHSTIWIVADSLTFAPTGGSSAQAINTTTKNMTIWGPGNVYVAGKISGSGVIAIDRHPTISFSVPTVSFSGSNDYSGATTISSGTLRVESDSALGANSVGSVTIGTSGTLELAGPVSPGGLTIGNKTLSVSTGGSIRNVSGSNSYAGAMTLAGDATITVDTGSTLNFTATGAPISIAAGKRLTLNLTNGDLNITKGLTGASASSSYVRTGSGALTTGAITNLIAAQGIYVRLSDPTGSDFSSSYGDTPDYTFGFFNSSTGSTKVNLAATDYSLGSLVWTTTGSGTTAPTAASNAGTYAMTYASGLTVSNASYVLLGAGAATNWTVGKAPLTVTANNASKTYGDPNPTFSATLSGFKNGQSLLTSGVSGSGAATTNATAATGAGTATITAGVGSLTAANYDFSNLVNGTLTINKAPLTVTANNASKTYGDANPSLSTTVSGFVNGETLATSSVAGSGIATTTATTATGAGTATITAGLGNLTAANYDFSNLVNGSLTINKAPLTVTANNASKTYGDANPSLSTTVSGFVNGEILATSGVAGTGAATTTATTTTAVGTAVITAGVGSLTASNYDFSHLVDGSLTIQAAPAQPSNNANQPVNPGQVMASLVVPVVIPPVVAPIQPAPALPAPPGPAPEITIAPTAPLVAEAPVNAPAPVAVAPAPAPVVVAALPQANTDNADNPDNKDRPIAAAPRANTAPILQGEQVAFLRPATGAASAVVPASPALPQASAATNSSAPTPALTTASAPTSVPVAAASTEAPRPAPTVANVNATAAAPAGTGVLAITILRGNNAQPTSAGVAFEQNADTVSLRATDAPPLPPSSERLVFSDQLTTFMVANSNGTMVEFQGSLVNNRMVIVAPSNAARLVAQTDMNTVLAAAVTSLGRDSRVMLAQLDGVVLDLR